MFPSKMIIVELFVDVLRCTTLNQKTNKQKKKMAMKSEKFCKAEMFLPFLSQSLFSLDLS